MNRHSSLDTNKLAMCFLIIACNFSPKWLHDSSLICQDRFPLKQVNGKFHTESKENWYTYLKNVFRCNYGEKQWDIGYTCNQKRYVASIGKVTVLHDCVSRHPRLSQRASQPLGRNLPFYRYMIAHVHTSEGISLIDGLGTRNNHFVWGKDFGFIWGTGYKSWKLLASPAVG